MAHRHGRVDANQGEIVSALLGIGASVQSLADIGCGCADLLVGMRGRNYLLEVKDGTKPPSARRLTSDEEKFLRCWRGQYAVVLTPEQAVKAVMG